MDYGICHLNAIPIRKDPSHESEMTSQLLFGEVFQVIVTEGDWIKIHMNFDFYEGWIKSNQYLSIEEEKHQKILEETPHYSNDMFSFIQGKDNTLQILSLGAGLPGYENGRFHLSEQEFEFDGQVISGKKNKSNLVKTAYRFLNTPHLWGGRTPLGIDCSGFTQMVYRINGHQLLRDAHQQASQGEVLSFIEECEPGDLAFFDNEEGEILHCGLLLADNHIMHCYEKVRIDRIDQSGIYNVDTKRHTHRLRVMKHIF